MTEQQDRGKISPPETKGESPFISVVLPVRNEEATIESVLRSLLAQDYPSEQCEFLVCDGYSTDRTREIVNNLAAEDSRVVLKNNPGQRSSAGRNVGYRHARGEYILFVDGHCVIPDNQLLRSVAELFASTGADCLCRPQPLVPDDNCSLTAGAIAAVRASRFGHSRSSYIYSEHEGFISPISVGAAYTRMVFETIGEYDESFDAAEDVEFNVRVEQAGFKSFISPRLKILYHARSGLGRLFRQMLRYGRGRFHLIRKHPNSFEWQTIIPPLLVFGLIFLLFVLILIPPLRGPVIALLLLAALGIWAVTIPDSKRFDRRGWPLYPAVFFAIYAGLGLGFIQAVARDSFGQAVHVGPDKPEKAHTPK